jgi:hypothetical protein
MSASMGKNIWAGSWQLISATVPQLPHQRSAVELKNSPPEVSGLVDVFCLWEDRQDTERASIICAVLSFLFVLYLSTDLLRPMYMFRGCLIVQSSPLCTGAHHRLSETDAIFRLDPHHSL